MQFLHLYPVINNDNVNLAIIGEDYGFKSETENLIKKFGLSEKVIFTGLLLGSGKKEALLDCNLFVMHSKYESFTTSSLEAIACSKIILLTKNNHINSWVANNTGLVCKYNENELAKNRKYY